MFKIQKKERKCALLDAATFNLHPFPLEDALGEGKREYASLEREVRGVLA